MSAVGDFLFRTAERRNEVNASAVAFGPEHDLAAVGRKVRFVVVRGIGRQAPRFAGLKLLHPNVQIVPCAVGRVSDQVAGSPDGGLAGQARIRGEAHRRYSVGPRGGSDPAAEQ